MNIAVMSPHTRKNGNSIVAALIASELSARNRSVCLTHTKGKSPSLLSYFNLAKNNDYIYNQTQLLSLIRDGGIRKNDIEDYCYTINPNLDLFSLNTDDVPEEQLINTARFVSASFPYDYVVFDIDDNNIRSKPNQEILKQCDCVVYVLSQDIIELEDFNEQGDRNLYWMKSIPSVVVVNRFCDVISSVKDVALKVGIKSPRKWYRLSLNPWIGYGVFRNNLQNINSYIQKKEYHVIDIDNDVKEIVNGILTVKRSKQKVRKNVARGELVSNNISDESVDSPVVAK